MKIEHVKLKQPLLNQARYEAIYWWNRDEDYYHKYFSQITNFYENDDMMDFFIAKIYNPFLKEYSIRRNLKPGPDSIKTYFKEIYELNFFSDIQKGNLYIIDHISDQIKEKGIGANRGTVSLLSKTAFLCHPELYSLYDSYARSSLKQIMSLEDKPMKINTYSEFLIACNEIIIYNEDQIMGSMDVLNDFIGSPAEIYFKSNHKAFCRRVFDKYLWLSYNYLTDPSKRMANEIYVDFYKL